MPRPVIGIAAAVEQARWGPWDEIALLLPRSYADAVQRAGGMAVMLPPDPAVDDAPDEVLAGLDALVLAGGADVDPPAYGGEPHPTTVRTRPDRDGFEPALTRAAV